MGSGGYSAFSYIGVLKKVTLDPVSMACSSAGSILAYLYILTQSIDEVEKIALDEEYRIFSKDDISLANFIQTYGFNDGKRLENLLVNLTKKYLQTSRVSFKQLFEHRNINLFIMTTNLNKSTPEIFSTIHTEDCDVITAILMSCAIPLYFSPILHNGNYYIDGGMFYPDPIHILKDNYPGQLEKTNTLVIGVNHHFSREEKLDNLTSYIYKFIEVISCSLNKCPLTKDDVYTHYMLDLIDVPMVHHSYTREDITQLINRGMSIVET